MSTARSPLDPLVRSFLRFVAEEAPGFAPTSRARVAAAAKMLDVPPELIDALFVSARARGFLRPVPHGRVRMRWQVSKAGLAFLAEDAEGSPALTSTGSTTH